jgi:hypothetical protein
VPEKSLEIRDFQPFVSGGARGWHFVGGWSRVGAEEMGKTAPILAVGSTIDVESKREIMD